MLSSQGPNIKRQPRFPDIILDICLSYYMVLYPYRNYLNEEMILKMGKNMLSTFESQFVPIVLVFREKKYGLVLLSNIFPIIKKIINGLGIFCAKLIIKLKKNRKIKKN